MLKHEDNAVARINGNNLQPLAGVSVTVTDKVTGLPASLYADDGTTPLTQPLITNDNGYYGFKAPDGTYTLTFSGQRIETFTREITLDDPKDNPYVTVASLAVGTGSSLVSYLNGGTPQSVESMFDLLYYGVANARNVRYAGGAVGNDVADDLPALQAALASGRVVYLPTGTYRISAALAVPNNASIIGDGPLRATIHASNTSFPVLSNADAVNSHDVTLKQICLRGGQYSIGISVSGVQSNWNCEDVLMPDAAVAAVYCNQMFLLNTFTRCIFDSYGKGVVCAAANANLNQFYSCQFKELPDSAVQFLGGSESNLFIGCRFEARNLTTDTGKDVIVLQAGKGNKFQGCYFEDTFVNILRETGSTNTTTFDTCRFSGQENGVGGTGFKAETFISDGLVTFGGNQFAVSGGSNGAANMLIVGANSGLNTRNANTWHHFDPTRVSVSTKTVAWASGVGEDLFTFARTNTFASANNRSTLAGTLEVTCSARLLDGTRFFIRRRRPVLIVGTAGDTMSVVFGTEEAVEQNSAGATLVISQKAGATATSVTIQAVAAIANLDNSEISARLDVQVMPSAGYDPLTVSAVAA